MKKISVKNFRKYISNIAIGLMLVCLFSLTYLGGTAKVFSSNSYDALYHGNLDSKNVSIMINVYMGTEFIEPMLEVLENNNAKATFFVGGSWVAKNSDILKLIDKKDTKLEIMDIGTKTIKIYPSKKIKKKCYLHTNLSKQP